MRLRDLAVETGRPVTWGLFSRREEPDLWRTYIALLEETAARGGRMFAQVHSRALTVVLSFKTNLPFDRLPVWRELRALPLDQQAVRLREPELRRRLVEAAKERDERRPVGAEARLGSYEWMFVMDTAEGPHRSVAAVARERGVDPVEAIIDLALEKDLDRFFLQPIANENQDHALELMKHPRTVVTFSDSGAHVSQIMDASLQTHLLSYWVRAKQAFSLEQAVRMLSFEPATHWGFSDRGLDSRGHGRRSSRPRSRDDRAGDARGRPRSAGGSPSPDAASSRNRRDRGERRGGAARRQAHRGAVRTAPARAEIVTFENSSRRN